MADLINSKDAETGTEPEIIKCDVCETNDGSLRPTTDFPTLKITRAGNPNPITLHVAISFRLDGTSSGHIPRLCATCRAEAIKLAALAS